MRSGELGKHHTHNIYIPHIFFLFIIFISDNEACRFIDAISHNVNLLELNMSGNLIGKSENLNAVKPDFVTGAEAVAQLLSRNTCALEKLILAWNMIRLDGAITLCSSLAKNIHLRYLDLRYNSLGQKGAEALGHALLYNSTLETVLLANNSIPAAGCFCICVAIEDNFSLKRIELDSNPIGEGGAKILAQVPITVGGRVKVSAARCNLDVKYDTDSIFDLSRPCNTYSLNLDQPFDRALALKLIHLSALQPNYKVDKCFLSPLPTTLKSGPDIDIPPKATQVKLKRSVKELEWTALDSVKQDIFMSLSMIKEIASNREAAKRLFREYDSDGSGKLDVSELMKLLRSLRADIERQDLEDAIRR
jgi:hypothetical protein